MILNHVFCRKIMSEILLMVVSWFLVQHVQEFTSCFGLLGRTLSFTLHQVYVLAWMRTQLQFSPQIALQMCSNTRGFHAVCSTVTIWLWSTRKAENVFGLSEIRLPNTLGYHLENVEIFYKYCLFSRKWVSNDSCNHLSLYFSRKYLNRKVFDVNFPGILSFADLKFLIFSEDNSECENEQSFWLDDCMIAYHCFSCISSSLLFRCYSVSTNLQRGKRKETSWYVEQSVVSLWYDQWSFFYIQMEQETALDKRRCRTDWR